MYQFIDQELSRSVATEQQARSIPLISAISNNQIDKVEQLLALGTDVNITAPGGKKTALHIAVERNNERMVMLLIEAKIQVSAVTENGTTPLHVAAQLGNKKIISQLIRAGASIKIDLSIS